MKLIVLAVLVAVTAVVVPTAATQAQEVEASGCQVGVFVEGRCIAVDGQSTLCAGTACVEFVEESVPVCPPGAIDTSSDPLTSAPCQLTEPASQGPDGCPDGARGTVGECFIYLAIEPDGCPSQTFLDTSNNCRRPVASAEGPFFCEAQDAQLSGRDCIIALDKAPSACPAGTARFDNACWRINGLSSPESCAGHQVQGTVQLASGRCEVPVAIPTGPATCVAPATYHEVPSYRLQSQSVVLQGNGPIETACIDESKSGQGGALQNCFYPDDEFTWSDFGDGVCTRLEEPTVLSCPTGFSLDDTIGGLCGRAEIPVNDQCPPGTEIDFLQRCMSQAEFAEFECPAGMTRWENLAVCSATRSWQGAFFCSATATILDLGAGADCFARSGPQPDRCPASGTVDDCFEVREPAPIECGQATGCVSVNAFDGELCNGMVVTIDMNAGASGVGTPGNDVILGTPRADVIDAGDGDDVVCAGTGADKVLGGNGNDVIFGQGGTDTLRGGPGADEVHGGAGADRVLGGIGDDTMTGGGGNDFLGGFGGADVIDGGPGNERIFGGFGADIIAGGDGNDVINGLIGDDTISGGSGDDRLNGDRGNDTINGDAGDDFIAGGNANDVLNGGDGNDVLSGGRADDTMSGGLGVDLCNGNTEIIADTGDFTCEQLDGIP